MTLDPSWAFAEALGVALRHSPRAHRLALRIDPQIRQAVLVVPPGVPPRRAHDFILQNQGWISQRLARLPESLPFQDGGRVPFLGRECLICHTPTARRGVWLEAETLYVSGSAEHLPRRVGDWLKTQARREIVARASPLADRIGKPIRRITIRDTKSRWGSCSSRGDLSFSWRLILAPEPVLDYVVAHEVAHLREAHHGPSFWALVKALRPSFDSARQWLKIHGNQLHRYG